MTRQAIATPSAPSALGTYSQAIRAGDTVYLSGQIPLDPETMELVSGRALARAPVGGGFPAPPFRLRGGFTVPP